MVDRPYVLLSCAMSVDGYIDDATTRRLLLSNDEDFDRVDHERSICDAILVGAGTLRADDPRLLVRSVTGRAARLARGQPENPTKVTLTTTGDIDPAARFVSTGDNTKLVYCPDGIAERLRARLTGRATVIAARELSLPVVLRDLAARGIERLLVEGGSNIHTQFLTENLADELHLVVAPFFVGDPAAPRFVETGAFPHDAGAPMKLIESRPIGDAVLLRYQLR